MLYIHIFAACSWIGGGMLLFAFGILIRKKHEQTAVYGVIGPLYGYFASFWLLVLLGSGFWMAWHYGIINLIGKSDTTLQYSLSAKAFAVLLLLFATVTHLVIAFKVHGKKATKLQTVLSRGGSMAIFILNFIILWFSVNIRSLLY